MITNLLQMMENAGRNPASKALALPGDRWRDGRVVVLAAPWVPYADPFGARYLVPLVSCAARVASLTGDGCALRPSTARNRR